MNSSKITLGILFTALNFISINTYSQSANNFKVSEIYQSLQSLNTLGTALYIAAHPDDENTRLITYLAKGENIRTGYISLTRGDGGQNLVGTEKGPLLGIIRTQELLSARRLDNGKQFFTRANDFGYSKTSDETFEIWDREQVLADLVWTIRKFRPDVLITRFAPAKYKYPTHGHHEASAILAGEAFDLAGDKNAFPGQLEFVDIWQPKRLYWNTSVWFYRRTNQEFDPEGKIVVDCGPYNAFEGKSLGEIAAESRSQHKSQGFGASKTRGSFEEYFEFVKGEEAKDNLFDNIDISWGRVKDGKKIGTLLYKAYQDFDPKNPTGILTILTDAYKNIQNLEETHWKEIKKQELLSLISSISGLFMDATSNDYIYTPGDSIHIKYEWVARSDVKVVLKSIHNKSISLSYNLDTTLHTNQRNQFTQSGIISENFDITQPYWLINESEKIGMYQVDNPELIGNPENHPALTSIATVEINGSVLQFELPVKYKWTDRVDGERYRDLVIAPPATVNIDEPVYVFENSEAAEIGFSVKSWKNEVAGSVEIELPEGWSHKMVSNSFSLDKKGDERNFKVLVKPVAGSSTGNVTVNLIIDGKTHNHGLITMDYDHINIQTLFPHASAKAVNLDLNICGTKVGYIMGAGDEVASRMEQTGFDITLLDEFNFNQFDLNGFDAVMVGIRAYNTEKWLPSKHPVLMGYVENGGNLIVQYQTTWGILTQEIGPYNFEISRKRVTNEYAEMKWLDKSHPLFHYPNQLTEDDFDNWVQERGLYFASEWDKEFTPVFESNDKGESPLQGSLIMADYGKGTFIYTGISFFRQLPAGVPGAYRLLTNMVCYGKDKSE